MRSSITLTVRSVDSRMEILKDNARPEAGAVYGALDMDWAKLVGQILATSATK